MVRKSFTYQNISRLKRLIRTKQVSSHTSTEILNLSFWRTDLCIHMLKVMESEVNIFRHILISTNGECTMILMKAILDISCKIWLYITTRTVSMLQRHAVIIHLLSLNALANIVWETWNYILQKPLSRCAKMLVWCIPYKESSMRLKSWSFKAMLPPFCSIITLLKNVSLRAQNLS